MVFFNHKLYGITKKMRVMCPHVEQRLCQSLPKASTAQFCNGEASNKRYTRRNAYLKNNNIFN